VAAGALVLGEVEERKQMELKTQKRRSCGELHGFFNQSKLT